MELIKDVISTNVRNEELIKEIQTKFVKTRDQLITLKKHELRAENALLKENIMSAKLQLISLEHGRKQILLPNQKFFSTDKEVENKPLAIEENSTSKPKQGKKPNPSQKVKPSSTEVEGPIDVSRFDLRVGKIIDVQRHPDADTLYVEKIEIGESRPRTVVSGLVKFIPIEEMTDRLVVVLCNLKPAKMRGIVSEAMVMCASTPEKVEILSPPKGSVPGDLIHCHGYVRLPDPVMNPKKKVFETCAPDLKTNEEMVACYKDARFYIPEKGNIVAMTLKNATVK